VSGRRGDDLWYFAYGSNLSPDTFTSRRGIDPLDAVVSWVDDLSLRFDLPVGPGERGVANLVPEIGARTWGVAYRITLEAADRLDRSEGVGHGVYHRISVRARLAPPRRPLAAFTYQSKHGVPGRKPSSRYLGIILDGARHHSLPPEWIARLEGLDLAVDERLPET